MGVNVVFETHAMSVDNERGIATGWLPGELSDQGRRLATELGRRRRDERIDAVYTSDLRRAVETAEIAFAGFDLRIAEDARLRECNYGEMNGAARSVIEAERLRRIDIPYPGGESWREAVARVETFLSELGTKHNGERVLLVGHVATRWGLESFVHGTPVDELARAPFVWQEGWEYRLPA